MTTKHKAIAIPVSFADDTPRFLTVRDRRFKEWIFVTGGCRKSEVSNPLRCAIRELEEETRAAVCIKHQHCSFSHFQFEVPECLNSDVSCVYHVYIIPFNVNALSQKLITSTFYSEKMKTDERKKFNMHIQRTHDENDMIEFESLVDFNKKDRWSLITDNIINNPEFYRCLNSLKRTKI